MPRVPNKSPDEALEADAAAVFDVMTELLRVYQFRDRDRVAPPRVDRDADLCARDRLPAPGGNREGARPRARAREEHRQPARRGDGRGRLVERVDHPRDARSVLLRATPLGRRAYEAVRRDIVRENAAVLQGLTGTQRATFIETLGRFTDATTRRIRGAADDA